MIVDRVLGMKKACQVCWLCLLILLASESFAAEAVTADQVITIDSGPISGVWADEQEDVRAYKGIPYAAAPINELRWKAPQPVKAWQELRHCQHFGKGCIQRKNKLGCSGPDPKNQSEDCLYLNVWTAAQKPERLPVMFFVHGGGFNSGSGAESAYDGSELARQGVIVVTFNYRLHVLGFFAHPWLSAESGAEETRHSGNYGILDMIAALTWVKRNINQFGGDPNNITLFGESAGASAVLTLMTSPLSRDLFQQAIMQSGVTTGIGMPLRGEGISAERLGTKLTENLGVTSLDALRALDPLVLADAYVKVHKVDFFGKHMSVGPIIDGYVLNKRPLAHVLDGDTKHIRLIIGSNADEGSIFMPHFPIKRALGYKYILNKYFDTDAAKVLSLFPVDSGQPIKQQLSQVLGIAMFVAPSRLMARFHAEAGGTSYLYHFTRVPPETKRLHLGAMHGLDISYIFGTGKVLNTETDKALSRDMIRAWSTFAQGGKVLLPNDLQWPAYKATADAYIEFGDQISLQSKLHHEACDLFEKRFVQQLHLKQ